MSAIYVNDPANGESVTLSDWARYGLSRVPIPSLRARLSRQELSS